MTGICTPGVPSLSAALGWRLEPTQQENNPEEKPPETGEKNRGEAHEGEASGDKTS